MSYTLSTSEMVAELQRRIPVGLSPTFCMDRLNEAYRWICQRGPMNWLLTQQWVTTIATIRDVAFPMPVDWDPGKPSMLSGDPTIGYGVEIPYKPYDLGIRHQTYGSNIGLGQYSIWTYRHIGEAIRPYPIVPSGSGGTVDAGAHDYVVVNSTDGPFGIPYFSPPSPKSSATTVGATASVTMTLRAGPAGTKYRLLFRTKAGVPGVYYLDQVILNNTDALVVTSTVADATMTVPMTDDAPNWSYVGILFPLSAGANGHLLSLIYHQSTKTPLSVGPTTYFPSPDVFDSCLIELAESEIRRVNSLAGWEIVKARTQEQVLSIIDGYHTTKLTMAGLADEARKLQEGQAVKAQ